MFFVYLLLIDLSPKIFIVCDLDIILSIIASAKASPPSSLRHPVTPNERRILLNGYDISFPVFQEYPAVRHYYSLSTATRLVLKDHTLYIDLFSVCSFPEPLQDLIQQINQEVLHTLSLKLHYMPLHLVHMQYRIYHFL